KVRAVSSSIVAELGTPEIVGATFTSFTVAVIGASVFITPSDTRTEKLNDPGPCASLGVHVKAPVVGSIEAPAGAPTRLNVNVWAGRSGSVAVAVKVRAVSSSMVAEVGTPEIVGATFTSFTVTVIGASALARPSDTRTVKLNDPGPWASLGV